MLIHNERLASEFIRNDTILGTEDSPGWCTA